MPRLIVLSLSAHGDAVKSLAESRKGRAVMTSVAETARDPAEKRLWKGTPQLTREFAQRSVAIWEEHAPGSLALAAA